MYPNIFRRYLCALIDALLAYLAAMLLFKALGVTSDDRQTAYLIIFLVLSYEPISTCLGCSVGQFLMKYRVRKQKNHSKINLVQAHTRLIVKVTLGIVSILVIPLDTKRRGLHDHLSNTIVLESNSLSSNTTVFESGGV